MKQTINEHDFIDAFRVADRLENFSYEARQALFEYLEQYEEDTGVELELDPIAICCDFSEDSPEDIANNYGIDLSECEDDEEKEQAVLDYLNDNTTVVGVTPSGIVYQVF